MAFAVIDRVRNEMLNRVGLSDLLHPARWAALDPAWAAAPKAASAKPPAARRTMSDNGNQNDKPRWQDSDRDRIGARHWRRGRRAPG